MSCTATHPSFVNEAGRPARRAISIFPTRETVTAARPLPAARRRRRAAAGRREA
jgi:hypothetical protein